MFEFTGIEKPLFKIKLNEHASPYIILKTKVLEKGTEHSSFTTHLIIFCMIYAPEVFQCLVSVRWKRVFFNAVLPVVCFSLAPYHLGSLKSAMVEVTPWKLANAINQVFNFYQSWLFNICQHSTREKGGR